MGAIDPSAHAATKRRARVDLPDAIQVGIERDRAELFGAL